jgi:hypothetical protein
MLFYEVTDYMVGQLVNFLASGGGFAVGAQADIGHSFELAAAPAGKGQDARAFLLRGGDGLDDVL